MDYYAQVQGAPGTGSAAAFYAAEHEWLQEQHHLQGSPKSPASPDAMALQEAMWQLSLEGDHHRHHEQQGGEEEEVEEENGEGEEEHEEGVEVAYPERPGAPDCVYYMRTGMCAFGMTCRYNHPHNRMLAARGNGEYPERPGQPECQFFLKTGTCKFLNTCKYHHPRDKASVQHLNPFGFPLRMGEKECSYYMRTGSCKYGLACKFNHPVPSPAAAGGGSGWPRPPYSPVGFSAPYHPAVYNPAELPPQPYPERPGMVECNYFMKTGDCKFGPACRFHHPRDRFEMGTSKPPNNVSACGLSPMGLPLRPGVLVCAFYSRFGICKFGPMCKFDHPMQSILDDASVTAGSSTTTLEKTVTIPVGRTPGEKAS